MAEKTHDQSILDVWATGYGSGIVHILEGMLGIPESSAKRIAAGEINRLTKDPIATEQLLGVLRHIWSLEHPGVMDINDVEVYSLEAHGDPGL